LFDESIATAELATSEQQKGQWGKSSRRASASARYGFSDLDLMISSIMQFLFSLSRS